jgi:dynein heavy chain
LLDAEERIKISTFHCKEFVALLRENVEGIKSFNYVCHSESQCPWGHWDTGAQPYLYPKEGVLEFSNILIPEVENLCIEFLMSLLSQSTGSYNLLGETGTEKTTTINTFLSSFGKEKRVTKTIDFSSATTPLLFQTSIESIIEKTVSTTFGLFG